MVVFAECSANEFPAYFLMRWGDLSFERGMQKNNLQKIG